MPLCKPLKKLANFRRLGSVLTWVDAFRVSFVSSMSEQAVEVFSPLLRRHLTLRPGGSDVGVLKKIFVNKEYTLPFDMNPRVIVDAGANIGMASLFFSQQFPEVRIIAIEPEPSNFAILQANCAGLDRIELVQAALWNRVTKVAVKDSNAEKWP